MLVIAAGGCLARPRPPRSRPEPPSQPEPPATIATKPASVRAIVTGVVLRRGDEIEVCPGRNVGPCAGIRVQGEVDDAWISESGKLSVFRLSGTFDGATLTLDGPVVPTTLADDPDYKNDCPEFQELVKGQNADPRLSAAAEALVNEHRARIAGQWWDRERQTMVVWVTGDPSDVRKRAEARAAATTGKKHRICIRGQARFSEAELEAARAKADQILREHGVVWSSSAGDVVHNQIVYEADAVDAATLAQLARETGDAIRVVAFIELPEQTLAQLPAPAVRGDIALATAKHRSGAEMAALGRFSVHYDAQQRCVYLSAQAERVLPVWPFGYWATSSPFAVHDYDGNVVAQEGQSLDFGGGQVELQHVDVANACGAKQAWIGRPQAPSQR
jgi:hypothetical protein